MANVNKIVHPFFLCLHWWTVKQGWGLKLLLAVFSTSKAFLGFYCASGSSKAVIARIRHTWYHEQFAFECRHQVLHLMTG